MNLFSITDIIIITFTTVVILSVRSEPVKWVFIKVHCCFLSSVTVISSAYNTYLISSHFSWVHSIDHDKLYSSALSENLLSVIADFWVSIYDTEQFTHWSKAFRSRLMSLYLSISAVFKLITFSDVQYKTAVYDADADSCNDN